MLTQTDITRILVPLDGSELATIALPYARAIATADTELVLCRVVPDPTPLMELGGTSAYPRDRIIRSRLADAEAYLDAVATVARDITPQVRTVTIVGEPADALIEIAEREAVDLVTMASHGRGFLGRVVAGSVGDRLARAATVPVMLIHPTHDEGAAAVGARATIGRILVPLDGSARAREALPVAAAMARQVGAPVHLFRALPPREELTTHGAPTTEDYYAEYLTAAGDALRDEANHLAATGVRASCGVMVGHAANSILDEVMDGDAIVMTSHGQGGVRRWLLGSVAERLIHAGEAPVVLVPVAERRTLATG